MTKKLFVSFSVMFLFLVFMGTACMQKKPDLTVEDITITPPNPTTYDQILFKSVIKNIGKKASPASVAAMRVGGETEPQQFNIPALNPGAVHTIQRIQQLNVAQNYRVTVYADYPKAVKESNENNNEKYKDFTVKSAPPLQVIYPTNSQDFQGVGDKYVLIVEFNNDVDKSTVVTQSTFIVKFPKDANAAGTLQWLNDRKVRWTSQKTTGDLCKWTPDCSFQLTIKDTVKDKQSKKLDGDKNGTPGGHFVHTYTHIG